jgi:hypothetical protein
MQLHNTEMALAPPQCCCAPVFHNPAAHPGNPWSRVLRAQGGADTGSGGRVSRSARRFPDRGAHFLAAQFYEDSQSSSLALQHAQQAMALDPVRYSESGRKLIDKLQTVHFGCWGVYSEMKK